MLMLAMLAATAMANAEPPSNDPGQASPAAAAPVRPRFSPAGKLSEPLPPETHAQSIAGEVPDDIVAKLRTDLAKRVGDASAASARVVRAGAVNWPNGAMGCPQPGRMYTQAIVPGYEVDFDVAGKVYSYRAATRGFFMLCEASLNGGRSLPPESSK
jgi:hypothetical protein